ncbi:MAG: hypothetical protein HY288_05965 [Planctomycetia bacterium]|nr:hypothetical protein [Planctomycetia bacterium]
MKIYYFETHENQAYLTAPDGEEDQCEPDPPRSLAAEWSPPTFELVTSDAFRSYLPKCDFPAHLPSTAILSSRAVERLRPVLTACGEILPIQLSNDRDILYLFNVTCVINAVDMIRSKFMKLPSGAIGPCERLVFDPALVPSDALFFKNMQMGPITEIFATQRAVAAVESANLTGYDFRLAWTDE